MNEVGWEVEEGADLLCPKTTRTLVDPLLQLLIPVSPRAVITGVANLA